MLAKFNLLTFFSFESISEQDYFTSIPCQPELFAQQFLKIRSFFVARFGELEVRQVLNKMHKRS